MTYVEYKQLNPFQKFAYNFKKFFKNLPGAVGRFFKTIGLAIVHFFVGIGKGFKNYGTTFVKGDWATKLSYIIFGFGDFHKGKYYKGILYFLVEVLYALFMIFFGGSQLALLPSLGYLKQYDYEDADGFTVTVLGHQSMQILLFATLTIVVTIVVFVVYISNIKDAYRHQVMRENGEKPTSLKTDAKEFLDGKYHITLLSFPILMISVFNILPLIFMILIAFTNYDGNAHNVLFDWVGLEKFGDLFNVLDSANKIAVPQFVSLLVMNQILAEEGALNLLLGTRINFLGGEPWVARLTVILVNCWVGIPYTILSMSGILMNIPEDLYESARIDGASPYKTFTKITLPYMIFVTTPQLITQFVGNINNFNVIFLLTNGSPTNPDYFSAGYTDILVTWLYNISMGGGKKDYGLASAIGILVFIICATLSLIIYNNSKSMKDEEAFS